jgi:hypothetical protein
MKIRFRRKNTYPCPVDTKGASDKIEEWEVKENETYLKNGIRYYDIVAGHGLKFTIPVEED